MRISLGLVLLTVLAASAVAEWKPSADPNPQAILTEAQDDAAEGRFEDALAKHVWFHENALTYASGMYGVRLSFALSYWAKLGARYPPALKKLRAIRDNDNRAVLNVENVVGPSSDCEASEIHRTFSDLSAINRVLGDDAKTSALFVWLDANRPRVAKAVYDVAEEALISAKEYKLCGKYLDAQDSFRRAVSLREEAMGAVATLGIDPDEVQQLNQINEKMFSNSAASLAAILVINNRKSEAERIAVEAREISRDADVIKQLNKALKGQMPSPWP